MVIVTMMGGLGNQMFQYAAGRHLSLRLNTRLAFDLRALLDRTPRENFTFREYELDVFGIPATEAPAAALGRFTPSYRPPAWRRLLHRLGGPPATYRKVVERGIAFDPAVLEQRGNLLLSGYWQSEKYFAGAAATVRDDFRFRAAPGDENAALARAIGSVEAVSIHVRRGDYLTNAFHGLCSLAYYREAVALVAGRVSNPCFFVFSDDPQWVQQHLALPYPVTYVTHNQQRSHLDLQLMSLCRHHIIANSSFSWWGAWLGNHPGKVVVAPRRWFSDESIDTSDLVPAGWCRI